MLPNATNANHSAIVAISRIFESRIGISAPEQFLEAVVAETDAHHAVGLHHHRAADQRRVFLQQQRPLRIAAGILALRQQVAPGGGGLVDQLLPAAKPRRPVFQRRRRYRVGAVVDEVVRHFEAGEPVARLLAGVAVWKSIQDGVHSPLRKSSLMLVLPRVFSSTCLTMIAAYRLWLPSFAGRLPATTTLPAGTRP